jgi:hypothetical protein
LIENPHESEHTKPNVENISENICIHIENAPENLLLDMKNASENITQNIDNVSEYASPNIDNEDDHFSGCYFPRRRTGIARRKSFNLTAHEGSNIIVFKHLHKIMGFIS